MHNISSSLSVFNHELLKNAQVIKSDYLIVRVMVQIWANIMNAGVANVRPVLSIFSLFSHSHAEYQTELKEIAKLSDEQKIDLRKATQVYGGETDEDVQILTQKFENWQSRQMTGSRKTKLFWFKKSDSLEAARKFKAIKTNSKIAITSFANAVRVGGADSTGGKGSQEEYLLRNTYLRVSLEEADKKADEKVRSLTGRYLSYYGAIVSKNVPTIGNMNENFGYISVAAPDLRTSTRSEGNYYQLQNNPQLVKEVLYRKLSVVMMSAAIEGYNVLALGAFGCGAYKNDPEMVAEVIRDILKENRFKGIFSHIILPIGERDANRLPFEQILKPKTAN
ncbi:MAG: TIGR02452 family protein [Parachlamydia sp.]|jgi:uncharacterized protein (TIGR02452 family)|nr:TIGR02452 family protein [Parachlamydia sp.]